ncbi:MAG: class I SAM-dependent methyltransferase [Flavobacteriales bacterium]
MEKNDPIGKAILAYAKTQKTKDIIVCSDLCDDDIIPVEVLFRSKEEMPELELTALSLCRGKVLDVGAGTGIHAKQLIQQGLDVFTIDSSPGAVEYLKNQGIPVAQHTFESFSGKRFDTLLFLMNGLGIAKTKANVPHFLEHAKSLLSPGGQILCDSSDVAFLYEEEDGSYWQDLNAAYYGNFMFTMHYNDHATLPFPWLYLDYDALHTMALESGFKCQRVFADEHHYLAQLTLLA